MAKAPSDLLFKVVGFPSLLLLFLLMAILGCGSVYSAIRIRVAGEWQVAQISAVSYANFSRAGPDMTYIRCGDQEYVWSTGTHEKVTVGESVAILRDPATGVGAAFPLGVARPTFFAIADKIVNPFTLWILPIIFAGVFVYSSVRDSIRAFRWLKAPFDTLPGRSNGTTASYVTGIAEATSHMVRRAVVLILVGITAFLIGKGLFYVQRFSIVGVGIYFTLITLISVLPLPEWGAAMTKRLRVSFFFAAARIVISLVVLGIFVRKAVIFLHSDLSKFETIGELLWDFIEKLVE